MQNAAVKDIYPPLTLAPWWALGTIFACVMLFATYWFIRWLRIRLALRAQKRLVELSKPHKAETISRALQEIERIKREVEASKLAPDVGAQQISLVVRTAFDKLMNHRTVYAAKFEVAARQLQTMLSLLDETYPTEFKPSAYDAGSFNELCDQAVKVVNSCN